ncbi:uncharacterized protein EI97DRAFT_430359 [Westerdykella ornata]|uniref:Uncharacterized protein n=1 Tax=Westerdykella ornata TaxID=318751 RepID=A0A6A6JSN6_WESOR|nr:uncharacterized protein EI97DRAFT_430359 [Westerdykella ornata]KAF2279264.1 hypothetical protein EI97DRAFT_430359 [Westerdykella ornata]
MPISSSKPSRLECPPRVPPSRSPYIPNQTLPSLPSLPSLHPPALFSTLRLHNLHIPRRRRTSSLAIQGLNPDVVIPRDDLLEFFEDEVDFLEHEGEDDEDANLGEDEEEVEDGGEGGVGFGCGGRHGRVKGRGRRVWRVPGSRSLYGYEDVGQTLVALPLRSRAE